MIPRFLPCRPVLELKKQRTAQLLSELLQSSVIHAERHYPELSRINASRFPSSVLLCLFIYDQHARKDVSFQTILRPDGKPASFILSPDDHDLVVCGHP